MQNKRVRWSAALVGAILIAIIIYAVYRGRGPLPQDGFDPVQNDGIQYVPPAEQRDLAPNEI